MTKTEFIEENMSVQGGTKDFWEEVSAHFTANNDSDRIPFREFLTGLSAITSGSPEEKLDWAFRLYDADGNGVLDRQEVYLLVKGVLRAQNDEKHRWSEVELRAKADALFDKMDSDKSGSVDKKEFVAVASQDEQIVSSLASNISSVAKVEQSAQEFTTFDQQVAGHSSGGMAMLSTGNTIMKPMSEAEFEFYVHAQKHVADYKNVFPGFFGRKAVTGADGSVAHYIVLEDLTCGLKSANIMDLKIGFRGHDDQVSFFFAKYKEVFLTGLKKQKGSWNEDCAASCFVFYHNVFFSGLSSVRHALSRRRRRRRDARQAVGRAAAQRHDAGGHDGVCRTARLCAFRHCAAVRPQNESHTALLQNTNIVTLLFHVFAKSTDVVCLVCDVQCIICFV
jgi:Ca2+-binding EF-hand superfamily protein